MKYLLLLFILLLLLGICLVPDFGAVTREDVEVYEQTAYIDKRIEYFPTYFVLTWCIADHVASGMKVVETHPELRSLEHVVFNYSGEIEDRYGNKRDDTWTRVVVPVGEWIKYSKDLRESAYQVRNRMLRNWIVEDFPNQLVY